MILEGQYARLHPYTRGYSSRDLLYLLWRFMEDEGGAARLFYAQTVAETPISQRGDLTEFLAYFNDPKRLLVVVQNIKTDQLAGMVWFDDLVPGFRAAANCFYRRRSWGHPAREGSRLAVGYAFELLGLRSVWAYTPFPEAAKHAEAIGMHRVAVLPGFVSINESPRDVHILKVHREDFQHG